jgi:hypothetical protein
MKQVQSSGQAGALEEVEITPEMIAAGADRLSELLEAGVGLSYAAEQVFSAMQKSFAARVP